MAGNIAERFSSRTALGMLLASDPNAIPESPKISIGMDIFYLKVLPHIVDTVEGRNGRINDFLDVTNGNHRMSVEVVDNQGEILFTVPSLVPLTKTRIYDPTIHEVDPIETQFNRLLTNTKRHPYAAKVEFEDFIESIPEDHIIDTSERDKVYYFLYNKYHLKKDVKFDDVGNTDAKPTDNKPKVMGNEKLSSEDFSDLFE